MLIDILKKLDLIKALVKEVFVVFYNLNTNIHACVQVMSLYSFAKCSRSKILGDMIAPSYYGIQNNMEILVLLKTSSEQQSLV